MLLSYTELVKLAADGVLQGVDPAHINGASIDITLGDEILVEQEDPNLHQWGETKILSVREREQPLMLRKRITAEHGYVLTPGEFILAHSREVFNLPLDISCEFKLKSSLARMGVNQLTACWCDPGWNGSTITLELTNTLRYHSIRIRPGDRIGQIVFFRHEPVPLQHSYKVRGRYNGDKTVSAIKL